MSWFTKFRHNRIEKNIKDLGIEWKNTKDSIKTYTGLFEISQKNVEVLKNSQDKERLAQETRKRNGLLKKIEELKKKEIKISEKVSKFNSEIDHDSSYK